MLIQGTVSQSSCAHSWHRTASFAAPAIVGLLIPNSVSMLSTNIEYPPKNPIHRALSYWYLVSSFPEIGFKSFLQFIHFICFNLTISLVVALVISHIRSSGTLATVRGYHRLLAGSNGTTCLTAGLLNGRDERICITFSSCSGLRFTPLLNYRVNIS